MWDDLEDWVRLPVGEEDVRARLEGLRIRAARRPRPILKGDGRLFYAGMWIALSERQEQLARPLVEGFGQPVPEDVLVCAGWPQGAITRGGQSSTFARLKRRFTELGLDLVTVRGIGHALQPAPRA
jgi:hypothetical protein